MPKQQRNLARILLLVFFFSGFAGLLYEVVWTRQLLLVFGNTTHSVVAVVAAFMAGLGLGSFLLGKFSDKAGRLLYFYSFLEFIIGFSALSTLLSFKWIMILYAKFSLLAFGGAQTLAVFKFLSVFIAILPVTLAMGGTLPLLARYFTSRFSFLSQEVSRLYAVNTFGATLGAFFAGFVFIELLGLENTVIFAAVINMTAGLIGFMLAKNISGEATSFKPDDGKKPLQNNSSYSSRTRNCVLWIFGFSGLISISYEVLWTRLLTPSMGTYVYAFSAILCLFLCGIALGSFLFKKFFGRCQKTIFIFCLIEFGIGLSAIISVVSNIFIASGAMGMLLTILPGTVLMGIAFPLVAEIYARQNHIGGDIGTVYALNTAGSIIGSLAAAFLIIPTIGTVKGIIFLSLFNFAFGIILIFQEKKIFLRERIRWGVGGVFLASLAFLIFNSGQDALQGAKIRNLVSGLRSQGDYEIIFLEDEVASTLGYKQKDEKDAGLVIDGVKTTHVGIETSLLAHLPILLHQNPKNMLVIAFGMGTTFRSALLHKNLSVDAVELVPSVPKLMFLFHKDAQEFLSDPRADVFINDGRNYLKMTARKYDIIVVDPPPPVNSAGTTVLYSKEFYEDAKKCLNPQGILASWFFGDTREDDFQMLLRSFYEVFPKITVLRSPTGIGYYLIGSDYRLVWDENGLEEKFTQEGVLQDVNEMILRGNLQGFSRPLNFKDISNNFLGYEDLISKYVKNASPVTDDHPRTEYFLIRHLLLK